MFVDQLFSAYCRYAKFLGLKGELLHSSFGQISAIFSGPDVNILENEVGKHVVQRYPKNDSGGRRHTSVVSVSVLPLPPEKDFKPLPDNEITVECLSGIGPGGQNVNKNHNVIRIRHKPTGLQAIGNGRDQHTNKKNALRVLTAKVNEFYHQREEDKYNQNRKSQVNTKRGGEKCRTYNFINSRCVDHRTGKKTRNMKAIMQGEFGLLQ